MGTSISTRIMAFNGQCANQIYHDEEQNSASSNAVVISVETP
jgi:hypothetical protein